MPRVTELKMIDGALWARVDVDLDEGAVVLWTDEEARQAKRESYRIGYEDGVSGKPLDEFFP